MQRKEPPRSEKNEGGRREGFRKEGACELNLERIVPNADMRMQGYPGWEKKT